MDFENSSLNSFYTTNDQDNHFKCDICMLTFRTPCERNEHILNHLRKTTCSVCDETLIQIGDIWYSPHQHANQTIIKNEVIPDDLDECLIKPLIYTESGVENIDPLHAKQEISYEDENIEENIAENITAYQDETDYKPETRIFAETIDKEFTTDKKDGIECYICKKQFKRIDYLRSHMSIHSSLKPYRCEIPSAVENRAQLDTHRRSYPNKDCNLKSTNHLIGNDQSADTPKSSLGTADEDVDMEDSTDEESDSKSRGNEDRRVVCSVCNKVLFNKAILKNHMNIHLGVRPYECNFCNQSFTHRANRNRHVRKIHEQFEHSDSNRLNDIEITAYWNDENFTFSPVEMFDRSSCPLCDEQFQSKINAKKHFRAHREFRFICRMCDASHLNLDDCLDHLSKTHTDQSQPTHSIADISEDALIDWMCEYCNKVFELEMFLARHILKHHSDDKQEHQCNFCTVKFGDLNDLLPHMRAHSENNEHKCSFDGCEQSFAYKSILATHLSKHNLNNELIIRKTQEDVTEVAKQRAMISVNGKCDNTSLVDESLICKFCRKKFTNLTHLRIHIRGVHTTKEPVACTINSCGRTFKTDTGLQIHIKTYHPKELKKCDECSRCFISESELAEHRRTKHEIIFTCNICSEKFFNKRHLQTHVAKKHGEELTCKICNKKLRSGRGMVLHYQRHRDDKIQTFSCKFKGCNEKFENFQSILLHSKQHPESEKHRIVCPTCGKRISAGSLKSHMNSHTGTKPYTCPECGKSFATSSSLKKHNDVHTGKKPKKPHVCSIDGCVRAFRDLIEFKRHQFSIHKIYTEIHTCSICSKIFPDNKLLTRHMGNVHRISDSSPPNT